MQKLDNKCPDCDGSGKTWDKKICEECNGTGQTKPKIEQTTCRSCGQKIQNTVECVCGHELIEYKGIWLHSEIFHKYENGMDNQTKIGNQRCFRFTKNKRCTCIDPEPKEKKN